MATARKTSRQVAVAVPATSRIDTVKTVTLTLDLDEAQTLADLLWNGVAGDYMTSRRKHAIAVMDALEEVDVHGKLVRDITGLVRFESQPTAYIGGPMFINNILI